MNVSQVMSIGAVCVRPSSTLAEAAALLRQLRTPALPVCENDRLCGLVTDRDLTRFAADGHVDPARACVREVMTAGIVFVYEDDSVERAAELMDERLVHRVPVLNRDHRLVGMIARSDLERPDAPAHQAEFSSPPCSDR